jgi:hypothetical protein
LDVTNENADPIAARNAYPDPVFLVELDFPVVESYLACQAVEEKNRFGFTSTFSIQGGYALSAPVQHPVAVGLFGPVESHLALRAILLVQVVVEFTFVFVAITPNEQIDFVFGFEQHLLRIDQCNLIDRHVINLANA